MRLAILLLIFSLSACQNPVSTKTQPQKIIQKNTTIEELNTDWSAHWLKADTIVIFDASSTRKYSLFLQNKESEYTEILLEASKPPHWVSEKYPHLAKFTAFDTTLSKNRIKRSLKAPSYILEKDANGEALRKIFIQTGFLLDDLYTSKANDADDVDNYGAHVHDEKTTFKLWAPTALNVDVLLFDLDKKQIDTLSMQEDHGNGVWEVRSESDLTEYYYQYQLTLYHPESQTLETLKVTDPYSLSLSTNSQYSQVVSLEQANTMPSGWVNQQRPAINAPEDHIIYEVHVRDLSAHDKSLTNDQARGKYAAFSEKNSAARKHLEQLRSAGLNTIHLLPTFDIGTINEDKNSVIDLNDSIASFCHKIPENPLCSQSINPKLSLNKLLKTYDPSTKRAQELISSIRANDNYNWGYDPYHYTVPEGSYAINPEGVERIVEFRQMIQSLHNLGFRVVVDVVYNHTHQAGLGEKSVLDKIVPGYYHRLHPITGQIEQSTCCDNTATERRMMAKLMLDSLQVWAKDYKIDGFRFDLMGHQPKELMLEARERIRKFDPDTYFYGEGWNFGEVANNRQFIQATQLEMAGTEIGTFSDRLRDAVRGCCFNSEGVDIRQNQGLGNGLGTIPNELNSNKNIDSSYYLLVDQLRLGLVGNLADFPLYTLDGKIITGKDIPYGDQPTGYALDPADTINYVSKHDNQTLWDNNQYRNAYTLTTAQRIRLHNQNLSYVLLAQGIPFIHMGSELLRSKSFLRDSYDYGDWFNKVDFSYKTNNYNVGLPPTDKDENNWTLIQTLLKNNQKRDHVSQEHISLSKNVFLEFLKIRSSSPALRMSHAQDIKQSIRFLNTGATQQKGLIAMSIHGTENDQIIFFNFSLEEKQFFHEQVMHYKLHPIQSNSVDKITASSTSSANNFTIPPLTTAVFLKDKHAN